MERAKISGSSPAVAAAVYDQLKGVDFSTDPGLISAERSPFAPNLMSGPGGYPEKRPGWRTVLTLAGRVWGLHSGRIGGEEVCIMHCGGKLYRVWPYEEDRQPVELYSGVNEHRSHSFVHQERLFILTGREYLVCGMFAGANDGNTLQVKSVSEIAKVPTIVFNAGPAGGGVPLQDRNLLTDKRTVGYVGERNGDRYALPEELIGEGPVTARVKNQETLEWEEYTEIPQSSGTVKLTIATEQPTITDEDTGDEVPDSSYAERNGVWVKVTRGKVDTTKTYGSTEETRLHLVVDRAHGIVAFANAPWDNSTAGSDNVEITYEKAPEADNETGEMPDTEAAIEGCDVLGLFEDRVFLSGNPDKPAFDWYSAADDPTYFPETGYARVGAAGTEIMGYLQVGSAMAVIKADSRQDASIYLRTAATLNERTVFTLRQGVSGQGAVAKGAFANILDDPLFLTRSGVFAVTGNLITEERTLANRSRFLDPRLTREANLAQAVACSWNGMYLLSMLNGTVYLLDGKQNKVYLENSITGAAYNYEAYHWTNVPATAWLPDGEHLFFGTEDGRLCRFNTDIDGVNRYNDDGNAIRAVRATRVEFCGDFLRYKTMVKKGSGLLMQPYSRSSVKVYVRTDRTKAQSFFKAALDDDDWQGDELGADFTAWEGAQVVPFKKKVKKWKWIQIIVENNEVNEGFGVYGIIVRHQKQNLV